MKIEVSVNDEMMDELVAKTVENSFEMILREYEDLKKKEPLRPWELEDALANRKNLRALATVHSYYSYNSQLKFLVDEVLDDWMDKINESK